VGSHPSPQQTRRLRGVRAYVETEEPQRSSKPLPGLRSAWPSELYAACNDTGQRLFNCARLIGLARA
jgi:hypothetical protein